MRSLLLLSLLVVPSISVTLDCSTGDASPVLVSDGTNCFCGCQSGSEVCATWSDITTAADVVVLDAYVTACAADNALLLETSCSRYITFDKDARSCTCPICDQTDKCTIINSKEPTCLHNECVKKVCTTETDLTTGNKIASSTTEASTDCGTDCSSTTGTGGTSSDAHECEREGRPVVDESFCWFKCVLGEDGIRRQVAYENIEDLISTYYGLKTLKMVCQTRNTELADAYPQNIVPVAFSSDAPGCGCGVVQETCSVSEFYRASTSDDGNTKVCTKQTCTTNTVTVTHEGTTYDNVRRTETTETVDVTFCESRTTSGSGTSDSGSGYTPPETSECSKSTLCDGAYGDDIVCCTKEDGTTFTTCRDRVKCLQYGGATNLMVESGRCSAAEVTEDECVLGTVRVSRTKTATSRCPKICKCVENPEGADLPNVEVCSSIEKEACFRVLKEKCAEKLGASGCSLDRMFYHECPYSTDDDICEKLFCDTDTDPTDLDNGGVCTKSTQHFYASEIEIRNVTRGCRYCECARDGMNELRCKRYDLDTTTSEGILDHCPELTDCSNTYQYDTRGVCGVCPVCSVGDGVDDDCDDEMLRSGDGACAEDPQNEPTRPDGEEIAGRVRLKVGVRACVDRFLGMTRSEAYAAIKKAALKLVEDECVDIDSLLALRCHVVAFEYAIEEATGDEDCDILVSARAVLHFSDTQLERLQKLKDCLEGIVDELPVKIRASLAYVTQNTELEATETDDTTITTNSADDTFYAEAGVDPGVELLDADGLSFTFETTQEGTETTAEADGATSTKEDDHRGESAAAGWRMVTSLIALVSALLF